MKRKCRKCRERTKAVCKHAFGAYWCVKSLDGEGCDHPLDVVAEAWEKENWKGKTVPIALPPKDTVNADKYEQDDLFKPKELTEEDY